MAQPPKGSTKTFAIVAAGIVVLAIAAGMALYIGGGGGGDGGSRAEDEPFKPHAVWPNTHVTNTPEANNEPALAVNPTDPDNIVAGSNDYGTPRSDAWCGFYATFDGGYTWERGLIPGYNGDRASPLWKYGGTGDPVLAFSSDGVCYMAGIAFQRNINVGTLFKPGTGIWVAKSTDGGKTFPQVVMVIESRSTLTVFHDKEWIAVDPVSGDVHVTWTAFVAGVTANIMHCMSDDQGQTWSRPQVISELRQFELNVQGSQCEVDLDGVLHVAWIEFGGGALRYSQFSDGGNTFSIARDIAPVTEISYTLPNGGFRTPTMCDMDVDRSGGNSSGAICIAWPDNSTGNADILYVASFDGGATWTSASRVNQDNTTCDQWFPAVCIGSDGSFQVMYYDRRDDANNTLLCVYVSISYDGGLTFTDVRLCDVQFDGDNTRGPFIGDYLAVDDGPGWTIGVWCDSREGSPGNVQSDIWCGFLRWAPEEEKTA